MTELAREHSGRVIALLARRFGDLDLADEAVQDAHVEAIETWPVRGIPDNPPAWLLVVARNRAIDRIRRSVGEHRRTLAAAPELVDDGRLRDDTADLLVDDASGDVADERLRLILLCCHPALDPDAQVALTLRLVGGLTTPEIAAAFLVPEATLAQRIVRAKRKIRDARIPLTIPADLGERIEAVLRVLYLVFNEGYLSRSARAPVRVDLAEEAIRLTRVLQSLSAENPEVEGLLALELYTAARQPARLDQRGELVLLADQDRSLWNRDRIHEANSVLASAMRRLEPGPFQLQALIAQWHAMARTPDQTNWAAIAELYNHLERMTGSPIVSLNRAVAVAEVDGPGAALAVVDSLEGLDGYHLFHATRGELLLLRGETDAARAAFETARAFTGNPAELAHLARRIAAAS